MISVWLVTSIFIFNNAREVSYLFHMQENLNPKYKVNKYTSIRNIYLQHFILQLEYILAARPSDKLRSFRLKMTINSTVSIEVI